MRHIPYTDDIGSSYRDADVFVFPTLEEGGPQVTLEAGGCGLPAIVTPMGAGRLVKDGVNGLVVRAGDVSGLVTALRRMANEPGLRASFARQIAQDAQQFTYERVSASRGASLVRLLRSREQ
ncbi:hypothetical protein GCM10007937_20930 [Mesorhizobium albiziae]|nr:hypothetical protein GCM10007937_20930 [Mesorhizobium albiziae]